MTDRLSELTRAIEHADSPAQLVGAVRALASARLEAAIPTLIQVLGYNNPGAAVAAVDGLVQLGSITVQPLLEQLDGYNYGARAYAIRALAAIGDPRALNVLLVAAETDFAPSVRRAATKGLGYLHWSDLPGEVAPAQMQTLDTLLQISQDSDWSIRYAAVVGLQGLTQSLSSPAAARVLTRLQDMSATDPDIATQARVRWALQILHSTSDAVAALPH